MTYTFMIKLKVYFLGLILIILCTGCTSTINKKRISVANTALKQVGINYKVGGSNPKLGFDCSGLVYYSYRTLGINIPKTVKLQYKMGKKVYFFRKPGDLIFFNINKKWWNFKSYFKVDHVGIYIGNNNMVHAPKSGAKVSVVTNVFNNRYWKKYYYATKRIIY